METHLGIVLAMIAALALAGQALSVRLATFRGRSADVLLVVILVNTAVLLPIALFTAPNPSITPTSIAAFAAAGIVGTVLGRSFFYAGIKRVGASRAEPVKATMPLHATLLALLILGEPVTGMQMSGILLIIGGIALVSWEGSRRSSAGPDAVAWTGLLLPLAAAFFFGLEPILASIGLNEGTPIAVGLVIKSISALLAYTVYLRVRGELPSLVRLQSADFRWYILAGLTSTGFLLAYYSGLYVSTVGVVVPIMQISPLIVVFLSALFLRQVEHITPTVVATAIIIVIGGVLVALGG